MARNIREIALAFFFAMCGIAVLMGILWVRPVIESQQLLIEETRTKQKEIMKGAKETKEILAELGYAVAIFGMKEAKMVPQAKANRLLETSIETIGDYSGRLGELSNLMNEYQQIIEDSSPKVLSVYRQQGQDFALMLYPDKTIGIESLSKCHHFKESGKKYVVTEKENEILPYSKMDEEELKKLLEKYNTTEEDLIKEYEEFLESR